MTLKNCLMYFPVVNFPQYDNFNLLDLQCQKRLWRVTNVPLWEQCRLRRFTGKFTALTNNFKIFLGIFLMRDTWDIWKGQNGFVYFLKKNHFIFKIRLTKIRTHGLVVSTLNFYPVDWGSNPFISIWQVWIISVKLRIILTRLDQFAFSF